MNRPNLQPSRARAGRASGSAYIIALLALVVLTILGLALALVTQSELQVGANERVVSRVFYAADTGIAFATAKALLTNDYDPDTFSIPDDVLGALTNLENVVDVSPFYPVLRAPCNLCEINNEGNYGARDYKKINHAVTTVATRRGVGGTTTLAEKQIAAMVEVQPWRATVDQLRFIDDPTQLAKVKF